MQYLDQRTSVREHKHKVMDSVDKQKFRIMDLPPEMRHSILRFLPEVDLVPVYLPGHNGRAPTGVNLPVTARAGDKLLRQETIMTTIEQSIFEIHSGPGNAGFQTWLKHVDLSLASRGYTNGFDAVKSLSFPYSSRYPHASLPATTPNNDIELMLRCRNLESVHMVWVTQSLMNYDAVTGQHAPKGVQQLRTEYRLDRMLGLRRVKKLTLFCRGANTIALHNMAAWLGASMPDVDGQTIQVIVS